MRPKLSDETKRKIGLANKVSVKRYWELHPEQREVLSQLKKGMTAWNKGLTIADPRVKKNLEQSRKSLKFGFKRGLVPFYKGKINPNMRDERHPAWKGDEVTIDALHLWMRRRLPKANYCVRDPNHKATIFHWANISHEYKRDVKYFMQLCPTCHSAYDRGKITLKEILG